jgi:uncharacterized protein (DUF2147 family)
MRDWTKVVLVLSLLCLKGYADSIDGFWKNKNEATGHPGIIMVIYTYEGKRYGRIIGAYDKEGVLDDTIYAAAGRAKGVRGEPFYAGLDFIWNVCKKGSRHKGKIMDPRKGKTYDVELWVENGHLIVRGEIFFFGKNTKWMAASESDFSASFPKPDVQAFTPIIPQGK